MTMLAHALSLALLHFVWQGALVAIALWIALFFMHRSSAQARYLASCAALAAMAILPAITAAWLYQRPSPSGPTEVLTGGFVATMTAATATGRTDWLARLQLWAVPAWFLGVLVFSFRLIWASAQVSELRRRGEPADQSLLETIARLAERIGLARRIQVLISSVADGPSVMGILKPVILIPAAAILNLSAEQLEAVLTHEMAHIRRYDYVVNIAQMMIEALLFYHPAVWWTSSRIRRERELCCDDAAVAACGDSLGYARALAALERLRVGAPTLALASTDGPLAFRIKRLVGASTSEERPPSKAPGILAVALAVVCLGLSMNRVHGQGPAATAPPRSPDAWGVTVDLGSTPLLHRTPIGYPSGLRNYSGTVTVEVRLDSTGNVSDARVLSGPDELRKTVLQSVLNWHFAPEAGGSTRVVSITFDPKAAPAVAAPPTAETTRWLDDQYRVQAEMVAREAELKGLRRDRTDKQASAQADQARSMAQLAELGAKLQAAREAAQLDAGRPEPGARSAEEATRFLEDLQKARQGLIQARQAEIRAAEQNQISTEQGRQELIDQAKARMAELQARLQQVQAVGQQEEQAQRSTLEGRVLKSINVVGVGMSTDEFLAKANLPLRVGDTLTRESVEATAAALRKFDEHLNIGFQLGQPGEATLTISAPGAGASGGRGRGPAQQGIPQAILDTIPTRPEEMTVPPALAQRFEGRTVHAIRGDSLPVGNGDFQRLQMPLRVGDSVTKTSMDATIAAVRKFDEHLGIRWALVEPDQVDVVIFVAPAPPASGGRGGRGPGPGAVITPSVAPQPN